MISNGSHKHISFGFFAQLLAWALTIGLPVFLAYSLIPGGGSDLGRLALESKAPIANKFIVAKSRQDLESLFVSENYLLMDVRAQRQGVPRLFLRGLPADLADEQNIQLKKSLFIRTVLPLILRVNEKISEDRNRVIAVSRKISQGAIVPEIEINWLSSLSKDYGYSYNDPAKLLVRLDVIPVSLALAQSIQESGWGTSRFAREGNALFGQRTWSSQSKGIVPDDREDGAVFKVKSFSGLIDSIQSYANNLNTSRAYKHFRARRRELKSDTAALNGYVLAGTLLAYSEEAEDYIAAIQAIIKSNQLQDFDAVRLAAVSTGKDLNF